MLRLVLFVSALVALAPIAANAQESSFVSGRENEGSATVSVGATTQDEVASQGSTGTAGAAAPGCSRDDGQEVPCSSGLGWWSATYDCYLTLVAPAPDDDPVRAGEGQFRCDPGPLGWGGGPTEIMLWLPLNAAGPDPALLAQEAIDSMTLSGISIATAPPLGTPALVNLPLWLWAESPGETTWGPVSATAAAGSVSVTATARAQSVTWDMGDGAVVTCGRGAAYAAAAGPNDESCSHTYRAAGRWQVRATTAWQVDWTASTGGTGSESLETFSTATVDVREARSRISARD